MLAEDVLMLLHHPEAGRLLVSPEKANLALGGALVVELTARQRITLTAPHRVTKNRTVVVLDATLTGDDVLDEALRRISAQLSARAQVVVSKISKGVRAQLLDRLAEQGLLRSKQAKLVGIIPVGAWPAVDLRQIEELKAELRQVLVDQRTPTRPEAATIALLHAVGATAKVLDDAGLEHGKLKKRAKAIASGDAVAEVVHQALKAAAF